MKGKTSVVANKVFAVLCLLVGVFCLLCGFVVPLIVIPGVFFVICGVVFWKFAAKPLDGSTLPFRLAAPKQKPEGLASKKKFKPCAMKHWAGLPLPDGGRCTVEMLDDRIVIESAGGDTWELAKAKVVDIERITESDVQVGWTGSPGMAALGALGFGVAGAVVGAAIPKERRSVVVTEFLCITYLLEGGGRDTLVLECDDADWWNDRWVPKRMVKEFKKHRGDYAPPQHHSL